MTPEHENDLRLKILDILFHLEPSIEVGGSILVQPNIGEKETTNTITIPGYNWEQIDSQLRIMCQNGIISSGSAQYDAPAIGIYFNSLTPLGHKILGK